MIAVDSISFEVTLSLKLTLFHITGHAQKSDEKNMSCDMRRDQNLKGAYFELLNFCATVMTVAVNNDFKRIDIAKCIAKSNCLLKDGSGSLHFIHRIFYCSVIQQVTLYPRKSRKRIPENSSTWQIWAKNNNYLFLFANVFSEKCSSSSKEMTRERLVMERF